MYSKSTNFKLYQKDNIRNYFSNIAQNIVPSISKNDDDYILNVNVDEYINYLRDRYEIDFPSFDFENVYVDYHEEERNQQ